MEVCSETDRGAEHNPVIKAISHQDECSPKGATIRLLGWVEFLHGLFFISQ